MYAILLLPIYMVMALCLLLFNKQLMAISEWTPVYVMAFACIITIWVLLKDLDEIKKYALN